MDGIIKTREHLEAVWEHTQKLPIKMVERDKFAASMLFVTLNHCDAIQLLIQKQNTSSGYALLRPLLETAYRAFWICKCATDEQINKVLDHDEWKPAWQLIGEVEEKS